MEKLNQLTTTGRYYQLETKKEEIDQRLISPMI